jgi:glucuronate isomerase
MTDNDRTDSDRTYSDHTQDAGADVTDEAFARTVDRQTSSDHAAQALFEREKDGATTDTEAAKAFSSTGIGDRERAD